MGLRSRFSDYDRQVTMLMNISYSFFIVTSPELCNQKEVFVILSGSKAKAWKYLLTLVFVTSIVNMPQTVLAEQNTRVFIDGKEITFSQPPFITEGTTFVPFKPIFQSLLMEVKWDGKTKTVTGAGNDLEIKLQINNKKAYINGKEHVLELAPRIVNGSTFVPLRFIAEATKRKVSWDGETGIVSIEHTRASVIDELMRNSMVTYEGKENDGKKEGNGKLYLDDILFYEGMFSENTFHGAGKIYIADNVWYEGNFTNGVMNGTGKLYYMDGVLMYEGSFIDGMMNGLGKLYRESGELWYEAEFTNEEINTTGTIYYPGGHKVVGEFKNGAPEGYGRYYIEDGSLLYEGEFKYGQKHGKGRYFYANGPVMYDGEWFENMFMKGKKFNSSGTLVYEGEFENGEPVDHLVKKDKFWR